MPEKELVQFNKYISKNITAEDVMGLSTKEDDD